VIVRFFGAILVLAAGVAQAQSPETLGWLRKIHEATQRLSYTGTFVYQNGGRTETSRITRYASEDIEKLEVLDGLPREIVRTKDTVRCYLPESRVIKVDRRAERGSRATTTSLWAKRGASPALIASPCCSPPRTICATATRSAPTSTAAC
jgi:sigma-E factor negative regulatory protein RseB